MVQSRITKPRNGLWLYWKERGEVRKLRQDSLDSCYFTGNMLVQHKHVDSLFNRITCTSHDKATFINMEKKNLLWIVEIFRGSGTTIFNWLDYLCYGPWTICDSQLWTPSFSLCPMELKGRLYCYCLPLLAMAGVACLCVTFYYCFT